MTVRLSGLLDLGLVVSIVLFSTLAQAASPDTDSNPTARERPKDSSLEEIIVTAQKREERLIDTPQAVTVLSSTDLTNLAAVQLRDLANTVPGFSVASTGVGSSSLTLRGVSSGLSSTVGIYVDDVPYGSSTSFATAGLHALDVGLFDLDRIEVLSGPQGTLYGASTMGGLLKYVTRKPDPTNLGGSAQAGVSETEHGDTNYNVASAINLPIVDGKAAMRISAFESHDGGYIDNLELQRKNVDHSNVYGGRLDLLLTPIDALSIRFDGFLQDVDRAGTSTANYYYPSNVPVDGSLDQRRALAEPFESRFRLVSGTAIYELGPASLTSISSYQTSLTDTVYDLSGTYTTFLPQYGAIGFPDHATTHKFTEEIRLASRETMPFQWQIGGFYTDETSSRVQLFSLFDLAGEPVPNNLLNVVQNSTYKEYAAFANVTYYLTSKLDVSAGLRRAHNDQDFTQIGSGAFGLSAPKTTSAENVTTYLGNVQYRFSADATGYLRYATGYRPGGPNVVVNDPTTGQPVGQPTFKSDSLKSYEAGFKAQTPDRNYSVDLAAYYIDWKNIQILTGDSFAVFANSAGGATIRGGELTFGAKPIQGLALKGAFSYQNARLSQTEPLLGGADNGAGKGDRLPLVPRFTGALNADYQILHAGAWRPTIGATVRREAGILPNYSPASTSSPLPTYTTADLRTGIAMNSVNPHGPINIQLYVHNLFDTRGLLSEGTGTTPPGTASVEILQPRTIGISVHTEF